MFPFGFDQASIALCRATLDFALRDRLGISDNERIDLTDLIKQARDKGLISDDKTENLANEIRKVGNQVMHVRPNLFNILGVINNTRVVLEDIQRQK